MSITSGQDAFDYNPSRGEGSWVGPVVGGAGDWVPPSPGSPVWVPSQAPSITIPPGRLWPPASRRWRWPRLQPAVVLMYALGRLKYMLCVFIFHPSLGFPFSSDCAYTAGPRPSITIGALVSHFEPLPTTLLHFSFWNPFPFWYCVLRSITFGGWGYLPRLHVYSQADLHLPA